MTGTPNTVCADARRQFSRIGLMFLVGTALIYGVQFGASAIANAINPDLAFQHELRAFNRYDSYVCDRHAGSWRF